MTCREKIWLTFLALLAVALLAASWYYNVRAKRANLLNTLLNGRTEEAAAILERGFDVNSTNPAGYSVLYLATLNSDTHLVQMLLDRGADPNVVDAEGMTPLQHAIRLGSVPLVRTLRSGGAKLPQGAVNPAYEPINLAIQSGNMEIVEEMLELGYSIEDADADILWQYTFFSPEKMRTLLEQGVDPNARDNLGSTLLHRIAEWYKPSAMQLLLEHGADVNARDQDGKTPLHYAAPDAARVLLEQGADLSARDVGKNSPLHDAAQHADPERVRFLLQRGADPAAVNLFGKTPADLIPDWSQHHGAETRVLLEEFSSWSVEMIEEYLYHNDEETSAP